MQKEKMNMSPALQEHSEEVEEIIGRKPAWILRWGIVIITLIIVGAVVASYCIKYPQTIISTITITSDTPPANLIAKRTGVLDSVSCKDGDYVKQGQLIALVASTADYDDIIIIKNELESNNSSVALMQESSFLTLGDIQSSWTNYIKSISAFEDYKKIDRIGKRRLLISRQLDQEAYYQSLLQKQRQSLISSVELEKEAVMRDSILLSENALSKNDFDISKSQLLTKENTLLGFNASLANAQLNQIQLEQELANLAIQRDEDLVEFDRSIRQAEQILINEIDLWLEQYAFIAPRDGIVSLHNIWGPGQRVIAGEIIASVSPNEEKNLIGRIKVPSSGFGKVKVGQDVKIKLNGFPYMEFGIIEGSVASISTVPENINGELLYSIIVSFKQGLRSSYKLNIPFVQDMDGVAEIITDDMRLIDHFLRPIRSLFVNKIS